MSNFHQDYKPPQWNEYVGSGKRHKFEGGEWGKGTARDRLMKENPE